MGPSESRRRAAKQASSSGRYQSQRRGICRARRARKVHRRPHRDTRHRPAQERRSDRHPRGQAGGANHRHPGVGSDAPGRLTFRARGEVHHRVPPDHDRPYRGGGQSGEGRERPIQGQAQARWRQATAYRFTTIPFLETAVNPFGSWRDRVKEGAYKSPSGTRIRFDFEDVSRSFEARGTVFEFPGIDNASVQRTGISSRRYPLTCYFTGATCDLEAASFEAALSEPGIGTLQHPLYGEIPVTPFGEIERRDDLVRAANQSIVTVTFWTTTGVPY